jgi:peroxiredoxin
MASTATTHPVAPGEAAPYFALPAVAGSETISLDDYRGRNPLFLTLLVGLWCPFCRRQLVRIGAMEDKLKALGVESLAVVGTEPENARLYFKFRPTRLRLASDPGLTTHRAYRVPKPEPTPQMMQELESVRTDAGGELPEPVSIAQAAKALQELDGYVNTATDQVEVGRQWPQLKAQFLIDRSGIVRWAAIECADGLAAIGQLPPEEVVLDAARACAA